MNFDQQKSHFSVLIYSQDVERSVRLRLKTLSAGYLVSSEASFGLLLEDIKINTPHVIVIDLFSVSVPLHEIIEAVLLISAEIRFVFVVQQKDHSLFENYYKYNLAGVVDLSHDSWDRSVLSFIDQCCENLFRTYQNEQLYEKNKKLSIELEDLKLQLSEERTGPAVRPYQTRIALYKTAQTKEELLNYFYESTPQQSWVYLKNIASIQTLIAVSFFNLPEEWIEGFSFKVPVSESEIFYSDLLQGRMPNVLSDYVRKKSGNEIFKFLPMIIKGEIEGVLISPQDISSAVAEEFSLMSLVYTQLVYDAQPRQLEVEDQLTGLYNEIFYKKILEKEVDRAQRSLTPLSVLKISIDQLTEIESTLSSIAASDVIKKVADVIKKTSRLPDYLCRTSSNEFSLILVNCDKAGAAIRAERLKTALKAVQFMKINFAITLSQGISEFPSLTSDAITLDDSARRALQFISEKGTDRVCIFKAPKEFSPIYTVKSKVTTDDTF